MVGSDRRLVGRILKSLCSNQLTSDFIDLDEYILPPRKFDLVPLHKTLLIPILPLTKFS